MNFKKLLNFFKNRPNKKKEDGGYDDFYFDNLIKDHKIYENYYTKELIEWINKENDCAILHSTSNIVNCWDWPDYLPSKPAKSWNDIERGSEESALQLHFICHVSKTLKQKADNISVLLGNIIWINGYYKQFHSEEYKNKNKEFLYEQSTKAST